MVWDAHGRAFDEGPGVARAWAEEHGCLLAPVSTVSASGFPLGVWLKNQRVAAGRPWKPLQRPPHGGCRAQPQFTPAATERTPSSASTGSGQRSRRP
ncbi:helicase associated domain-containing protein [Streptomyces sp. NPDC050400]|uniref:helicase associated domain-containing protein n=1 Tax=Streptomyces sp. NPDC050400 TaxID=3365610 RepID=UPI0037B3A1DE